MRERLRQGQRSGRGRRVSGEHLHLPDRLPRVPDRHTGPPRRGADRSPVGRPEPGLLKKQIK